MPQSTYHSALPRTLDDVIRENRQSVQLYCTTQDELRALLTRVIPAGTAAQRRIHHWRLISMREAYHGKPPRCDVHVLGDTEKGTYVSSPLAAVDLGSQRVVTASGSVHELVGSPAASEPPTEHLLQLCAALWAWGYGRRHGVPHITLEGPSPYSAAPEETR